MAEVFSIDGPRGMAVADPGPDQLMNPEYDDRWEMYPGKVALLANIATGQLGEGAYVLAGDNRSSNYPNPNPAEPGNHTAAAVAGIEAAGGTVLYGGVIPTPAVQLALQNRPEAMGGVMLTASHNPDHDNGAKFFGRSGVKLSTGITDVVAHEYMERRLSGLMVPWHANENPAIAEELRTEYVNHIVSSTEAMFGEQPLKDTIFVIDGANGATSITTPEIFERLGATVHRVACDQEGKINDGSGVMSDKALRSFLENHHEIVNDPRFIGAISHDGDGDRVFAYGARIENGQLQMTKLDGNIFIEVLAEKFTHGLPDEKRAAIATIYANPGSEARLADKGIKLYRTGNGDIPVSNLMDELGIEVGGEFSGHVRRRSHLPSGDGGDAAAVFASIVVKERGKTFADIAEGYPLWPEVHKKIMLGNTAGEVVMARVAGARADAEELMKRHNGLVIVRPASTEPLVRVTASAEDAALAHEVVASLEREVLGVVNNPAA